MIVEHEGYCAETYHESKRFHLHVVNCTDSLSATFDHEGDAQAALVDLIADYRMTCAAVGKKVVPPAIRS